MELRDYRAGLGRRRHRTGSDHTLAQEGILTGKEEMEDQDFSECGNIVMLCL